MWHCSNEQSCLSFESIGFNCLLQSSSISEWLALSISDGTSLHLWFISAKSLILPRSTLASLYSGFSCVVHSGMSRQNSAEVSSKATFNITALSLNTFADWLPFFRTCKYPVKTSEEKRMIRTSYQVADGEAEVYCVPHKKCSRHSNYNLRYKKMYFLV